MLDRIVGRLQRLRSPMLILDEADKLSPEALRLLIPLYNELEEHISVVMAGTEHLKKHMRNGVIYRKKGYDELESRFGRSYFSLLGATKEDVRKIAEANGYKGDIAPLWEACERFLHISPFFIDLQPLISAQMCCIIMCFRQERIVAA